MRHALLPILSALLLTGAAPAAKPEKEPPGSRERCGWVVNSTSSVWGRLMGGRSTTSNWWLIDEESRTRNGWLIRAQGGYTAAGFDILMKDLRLGGPEWHVAQGEEGYRCACLQVRTDARNRQITRIYKVLRQEPIAQCRGRKGLPKPL